MFRFDPYSYEHHEDPYPTYRRLRDEAPAYFDEERGFWALSRHADVRSAVHDWQTYTSSEGITLETTSDATEPMIIEMDPPRHTQLRSLVSRAFTPRRVAALEAPCRSLARKLADRIAPTGTCDAIGDFAAILPMAVISWMLEVPDADQDELRAWSDAMLHRAPGDPSVTPAGLEGATNLFAYFDQLVAERREHRGDDLVSVLIEAEDDGERLTHNEVLGFCFLLIIAGNETTTKLLGNALYWLWRYPDQRARLLADRSLVSQAVEETLRFDGSTQAMARALTRDVELHGCTMEAGRKVLLLFGAANRDERFWGPTVDTFDLGRDTTGHLAFGHGIHFCLGAAIARLEARVALEELLWRLPDYHVIERGVERVHSGNVRGYSRLPLEFTPAS
jgi:cytochrome P450